jgi:hypothetical protein
LKILPFLTFVKGGLRLQFRYYSKFLAMLSVKFLRRLGDVSFEMKKFSENILTGRQILLSLFYVTGA